MKRYLIMASCLALAVGACQRHETSATGGGTADTGGAPPTTVAQGNPAAAVEPPPAAAAFVAAATGGDMYEIQAARIAERRSKNPDVRDFAKMMIVDHSRSTAMVKQAVADSGRPIHPPTALPGDKKALIDSLNTAPDSDFDRTYVDQQVSAHRDALALMTSYSTMGDTPPLKDAAAKIAPVVQSHLDKITAIQNSLH